MEQSQKICRLEDIKAWQEAKNLMSLIYKIIASLPRSEEYNLGKHMRECSRNVPGNIAEGFGRFNYQECVQFYRIGRGSLYELKSDLNCCFELGFIENDVFKNIDAQIETVIKLLNGLIKSASIVKRKKP